MQTSENIWRVSLPDAWPQAPVSMSYSTLADIEACPRQWALMRGEYSSIWSKKGYPRSLQVAAFEGSVVHLALETITAELVECNCSSPREEFAIAALRSLGGFSTILNSCVEELLHSYAENPRVAPILPDLRREVLARIPALRGRLQRLLSRLTLCPIGPRADNGQQIKPLVKQPLSHGSHPEVRLEAPCLAWHGVADLLSLSSNACEIRDFKTGAAKDVHKLQLRVYALLWYLDLTLNPNSRIATRLMISYSEGDTEVATPTVPELELLKQEIAVRTSSARAAIVSNPPPANLSQENCSVCIVRQLCDEYWQWLQANVTATVEATSCFTDIEVRVRDKQGPNTWNCDVRASSFLSASSQLLLRIPSPRLDIVAGSVLRLINVQLKLTVENSLEEELKRAIATVGRSSEVFIVNSQGNSSN